MGERKRNKILIDECVDALVDDDGHKRDNARDFVNLILDLARHEAREELAERDARASEARAHKEEDKTVREIKAERERLWGEIKAGEARAHKEEAKVKAALDKIRAEASEALPPRDDAKPTGAPEVKAPAPCPTGFTYTVAGLPPGRYQFMEPPSPGEPVFVDSRSIYRVNKPKPTGHDPAPAPVKPSDTGWYNPACEYFDPCESNDGRHPVCTRPTSQFKFYERCQGCPGKFERRTETAEPKPEPEASKASKPAIYDRAPNVPCKLVDPFNPAHHPAPFAACSHCGDAMMFAEALGYGICMRCRWFAMLPNPGEDMKELRFTPSAKPEPDVAPQDEPAPEPARDPASCPDCGEKRQGVTGIHWRSWYCTPCGKVTTRA